MTHMIIFMCICGSNALITTQRNKSCKVGDEFRAGFELMLMAARARL